MFRPYDFHKLSNRTCGSTIRRTQENSVNADGQYCDLQTCSALWPQTCGTFWSPVLISTDAQPCCEFWPLDSFCSGPLAYCEFWPVDLFCSGTLAFCVLWYSDLFWSPGRLWVLLPGLAVHNDSLADSKLWTLSIAQFWSWDLLWDLVVKFLLFWFLGLLCVIIPLASLCSAPWACCAL